MTAHEEARRLAAPRAPPWPPLRRPRRSARSPQPPRGAARGAESPAAVAGRAHHCLSAARAAVLRHGGRMRRGVSFCGGHAGAFERATSPSSEFVDPDAVRAKARTREHGAVCLSFLFFNHEEASPNARSFANGEVIVFWCVAKFEAHTPGGGFVTFRHGTLTGRKRGLGFVSLV